MARTLSILTAAFMLSALPGCGGGESDVGDQVGADSPQTVAAHATCDLDDFHAEALAQINAQRARRATCGALGEFAAAPPLTWNEQLTQAGLVQSDDMMTGNFFSHAGSTGQHADQRFRAAGYDWTVWGENIAAGQRSVASVVAAWMASDSHCANIMNPAFRDIGLVCVKGTTSNTYRTYWTLTMGRAH